MPLQISYSKDMQHNETPVVQSSYPRACYVISYIHILTVYNSIDKNPVRTSPRPVCSSSDLVPLPKKARPFAQTHTVDDTNPETEKYMNRVHLTARGIDLEDPVGNEEEALAGVVEEARLVTEEEEVEVCRYWIFLIPRH
jgi:hypothetical protein